MWKEQGVTFWKKFTITFRSFTNRHGVIKEISNNSPKFEDFIDQAFIFIHENFVEGREGKARNFIDDIAKLAQNRERFKDLDSKSFAKDPFYLRDTRDLFRRFFGPPDQKSSYLKVYVVSPIYLRFGGSAIRCLRRWLDAPTLDEGDESYWVPSEILINGNANKCSNVIMCEKCLDDCSTKYFREKFNGKRNGPSFVSYWKLGDPRFNDEKNPLYAPFMNELSDWRDTLTGDNFRDFLHYAKFAYGSDSDKCQECLILSSRKCDPMDSITVGECKSEGRKKKKKRKKKNKAKLAGIDVDNEIDDLVAHIEGEKELVNMPQSTVAGARWPQSIVPFQQEESVNNSPSPKKKKNLTDPIKTLEDYRAGMMQARDDLPKNSRIGGYKAHLIENEATGERELTITVQALKGEEGRSPRPRVVISQNCFPLSAQMIRGHLDNLPDRMEWYEGDCWCACVLNYSVEEKENPSNFTIKVVGPDEDTTKRTMFKLLFYVGRRKTRPCPGWVMEEDDVVACILPDDCPPQDGLTIVIIKGFNFQDRLTDQEKQSMIKGEDIAKQPDRVLMTIKGENIKKLIEDENGREVFRMLLDLSNYSNELSKGNPEGGSSSFQPTSYIIDQNVVRATSEPPVWSQIEKEPETFELFFKIPKENEEGLQSIGFQTINHSFFDKEPMNNIVPSEGVFCLRCKQNRRLCQCGPFKRFVELDPCGMKGFQKSQREEMDLRVRDRKPVFEEVLLKTFENHTKLKEKHKQRLKEITDKMQSVEEVIESREELYDLINNVMIEENLQEIVFQNDEDEKRDWERAVGFGKGCKVNGVNDIAAKKGKVEKERKVNDMKENRFKRDEQKDTKTPIKKGSENQKNELRHSKRKPLENSGNERKVKEKDHSDAKGKNCVKSEVKVEGKHSKVKLTEKGAVENARTKRNEEKEDLEKSGILGIERVGLDTIYYDDNDDDEWETEESTATESADEEPVHCFVAEKATSKTDNNQDNSIKNQSAGQEGCGREPSEAEIESLAKLMEQSDGPGLEVKVRVEATRTEEVKVESEAAKTDEDIDQWNKNKRQAEVTVVEQSGLLMNDQATMLEKRNENKEHQKKFTAGFEQVSIDQDSKESTPLAQEKSEEIPKENGLVVEDHGKPSSTENRELEQGQEKLEKNVQNLRHKEEEEQKSETSTDIQQPKEEEKSATSNDTKQPKEEQEISATSSDIKDPKVEEESTISIDIKQLKEKEEEKSDTSNDIQQPIEEQEKSATSTDINDPRVEEESATPSDIKQPKEEEKEEKPETSNDIKQNKDEEKSAASSDIKEPEAMKGNKSNLNTGTEPENSAENGGPDLENKNKEDSNSKEEILYPLESNPVKYENSNRSLKKCSSCGSEEPAPKAYKKCLKCKLEGIASARYYCGKVCQTSDWRVRHKEEHKKNLLDRVLQ